MDKCHVCIVGKESSIMLVIECVELHDQYLYVGIYLLSREIICCVSRWEGPH